MALAEVKGVQAGPGEKAFGFLEVGTTRARALDFFFPSIVQD